jgi:hypothetical protein
MKIGKWSVAEKECRESNLLKTISSWNEKNFKIITRRQICVCKR